VLTQANGVSHVHETVYEDRFGYIEDLVRMGAAITVTDRCAGEPCRFQGQHPHVAEITGPTEFRATTLTVRDIRAGMAHVIAALAAHGESIVEQAEALERGYESVDRKLQSLGAAVQLLEQ
jgi:UDP-N-acetylglucosamine 1-carboxyvinyltransferase